MVKAPNSYVHKDIIDYFIQDKEVVKYKSRCCRLDVLHPGNHRTFFNKGQFIDRRISIRDGNESYDLRHSFHYDLETFDGDCGSLVSIVEPQMTGGRIVGIHVAGAG